MLLLRTYHHDDYSAIMQLLLSLDKTLDEDEIARLQPLLINNYTIVCEVLGKIVGYALFFVDQGHIFSLRTQANMPEQEDIIHALLRRIQEKATESKLTQVTINNIPIYQYLLNFGFKESNNPTLLSKNIP
ncbi:hypothetical protein [Entomospira culicis]|nr:hypothetical protein [Entomospira culicis]WDI36634.1 hypothetical protein PVA46_04735 [Entomospira culicis]